MRLLALAIVLAAVLVAGALILTNRYTVYGAGEGQALWRVDQFTGETHICIIGSTRRGCLSVPDGIVGPLPDDLVSPDQGKR